MENFKELTKRIITLLSNLDEISTKCSRLELTLNKKDLEHLEIPLFSLKNNINIRNANKFLLVIDFKREYWTIYKGDEIKEDKLIIEKSDLFI